MAVTAMKDPGGFGRLADVKFAKRAEARAKRKLGIAEKSAEQSFKLGNLQIQQMEGNLQKIQNTAEVKKGLGQAMSNIPEGENQFTTAYNYLMMKGESDLAQKYMKNQSDKIEQIYKMDPKQGIEAYNNTIGKATGNNLEYIKADPVQGDIIRMKDERTGKITYGSRTKSGGFVPLPNYLSVVEDPEKRTKSMSDLELEDKLTKKYEGEGLGNTDARLKAQKAMAQNKKDADNAPIYSDLGKLRSDLREGFLTEEEFKAEKKKLSGKEKIDYAPTKLTKLYNKLDELPVDSPRRQAYQNAIDMLTTDSNPEVEMVIAQRIVDNKLDFNSLSRRGGQKGRIAAIIAEIAPDFNLIDAAANIKYKTDPANLKSIALISGISPLFDELSGQAKGLNNGIIPILNKGINFYKRQTGEAKIVAFDNLRDDVIAETERVLLGTGALSDSKYLRALGNLNSAQSPKQMGAAIQQMILVVKKREEALRTEPYPQGGNKPIGDGKADPDMEQFWE